MKWVVLGLFSFAVACGAKEIVCPIIHTADVVCPYVLLELPDGGYSRVGRTELEEATQKTEARLRDAGVE